MLVAVLLLVSVNAHADKRAEEVCQNETGAECRVSIIEESFTVDCTCDERSLSTVDGTLDAGASMSQDELQKMCARFLQTTCNDVEDDDTSSSCAVVSTAQISKHTMTLLKLCLLLW